MTNLNGNLNDHPSKSVQDIPLYSLSDSLAALRLVTGERAVPASEQWSRTCAILGQLRQKRLALENAIMDYAVVASAEGTDSQNLKPIVSSWVAKITQAIGSGGDASHAVKLSDFTHISSCNGLDEALLHSLNSNTSTSDFFDENEECPPLEDFDNLSDIEENATIPFARSAVHSTDFTTISGIGDNVLEATLVASSPLVDDSTSGTLVTPAVATTSLASPTAAGPANVVANIFPVEPVDPTLYFIYFREVPPADTVPYYPSPSRPIIRSDKWYYITKGKAIGVFADWSFVAPFVQGVSNNVHKGKKTCEEACTIFWAAVKSGSCEILP